LSSSSSSYDVPIPFGATHIDKINAFFIFNFLLHSIVRFIFILVSPADAASNNLLLCRTRPDRPLFPTNLLLTLFSL
jgi:hypothetical protein